MSGFPLIIYECSRWFLPQCITAHFSIESGIERSSDHWLMVSKSFWMTSRLCAATSAGNLRSSANAHAGNFRRRSSESATTV